MTNKYQFLFFDLDQTLWDYRSNASEALLQIFGKYGLQLYFDSYEQFRELFFKYNELLWQGYREGTIHKDVLRTLRFEKIFKDVGIENHELCVKLNTDFLSISPKLDKLVPGAVEVLLYLKSKKYKLNIITNGFTQIQEMKIKYSGIDGFFDKMFTSESVGNHKPHRDIFEYAIKSTNARKIQSLMIGDDQQTDIAGARKFGIDQVFYNPGKQLLLEKVTYQIEHLLELKNIL